MIFTITARTKNLLIVLQRLASFTSRNRLHIYEIHILECDSIKEHDIALVIISDKNNAEKLFKQMKKLIDLSDVKLHFFYSKEKAS